MNKDITFKEAIETTKSIISRFEKIEEKKWGVEGSMIELSKQVGELSKFVMMQERYYFADREKMDSQYETNNEKIGDELADVLFCLIRIAKHYDIDLVESHIKARQSEDSFLQSKGV